jgi:hypothetical protein
VPGSTQLGHYLEVSCVSPQVFQATFRIDPIYYSRLINQTTGQKKNTRKKIVSTMIYMEKHKEMYMERVRINNNYKPAQQTIIDS